MRIEVSCVDRRLSEALHAKVSRRVLLALSRFGPRVAKVTVRLTQPTNPLGGIDHGCRMRARVPPGSVIHVEAIDGTIEAAVARAAAQLADRVAVALLGGRAHDGVTAARGGPAARAGWPLQRASWPRPTPPDD